MGFASWLSMKTETYRTLFWLVLSLSILVFFWNALFILGTLAALRAFFAFFFLLGLLVCLVVIKKCVSPVRFYTIASLLTLLFLVLHSGYIYQEYVYSAAATVTRDVAFCQKAYCPSCCISDLITVKSNIAECARLKYGLESYCRKLFAEMRNDVSRCDQLYAQREDQNNCFFNLAARNKNVSYCASVSPEAGYQDKCLKEVAVAKRDLALCRSIGGVLQRDDCLRDIAIIKSDSSLCEEMEDPGRWQKQDCLIRIAKPPQTRTDYCLQFLGFERNSCLKTAALEEKSVAPCQHLIEKWEQEQCEKAAIES